MSIRSYALLLALMVSAPGVSAEAVVADVLRQAQQRSFDTGQAQGLTVIIESDRPAVVAEALARHDFPPRLQVQGRFELRLDAGRLDALAAVLPPGSLIRPSFPHVAHGVTSQGVELTGAIDMHTLEARGAGIKVGVIDLGFTSLASSQSSGELPMDLSIVDYTGNGTGGTNHGTQVAEIVHDMAPQAQLFLARVGTDAQLQQAVNDMAAAGVQVINHSVGWYGAAFYDGTGTICDAVDTAAANGVQWVNSAGNDRLRHYLGTFADANADLRHEFAAGQDYNTFTLNAGKSVTLVLNWDDYPSSTVDYDLYLYDGDPDAGGSQVAVSQNRQSGKGASRYPYPYESVAYTSSGGGTYYAVVRKVTSATPHLPLSLFSLGANLTNRTTASSLAQPADCANSLSVAATTLTDGLESFSAEGPTTDGRAKPELTAPNRVATSFTSSFAGTSAASPHVAGAVALVAGQLGITSQQAAQEIRYLLHDVHTAGFDYRTGDGRLSLDADGDGLNRDQELYYGTDPQELDSDGDGLGDYDEIFFHGTDPLDSDSDGDGLTDYEEIHIYGTDPLVSNQGDIAPAGAPDGAVNLADLARLMRFIAAIESPDAREQALADINDDGVLDIRDAQALGRMLGF